MLYIKYTNENHPIKFLILKQWCQNHKVYHIIDQYHIAVADHRTLPSEGISHCWTSHLCSRCHQHWPASIFVINGDLPAVLSAVICQRRQDGVVSDDLPAAGHDLPVALSAMICQQQARTSQMRHWRWSVSVVVGGDLPVALSAVICRWQAMTSQWRHWQWSASVVIGSDLPALLAAVSCRRRQGGVVGDDLPAVSLVMIYQWCRWQWSARCRWQWSASGRPRPVSGVIGGDLPMFLLGMIFQLCRWRWSSWRVDLSALLLAVSYQRHCRLWLVKCIVGRDLSAASLASQMCLALSSDDAPNYIWCWIGQGRQQSIVASVGGWQQTSVGGWQQTNVVGMA